MLKNEVMPKQFSVDIMINDRYIHTMEISTLLADKIGPDGRPAISVEKLCENIEKRLPSLKGQQYNVCF